MALYPNTLSGKGSMRSFQQFYFVRQLGKNHLLTLYLDKPITRFESILQRFLLQNNTRFSSYILWIQNLYPIARPYRLRLIGNLVRDCLDLYEVSWISEGVSSSIAAKRGEESSNIHQNHWHTAHALSIFDKAVFLKYSRRQCKCKKCKKPFSESLHFIGERRQYTDRFAERIVKQLVHSDMHNVAKNNH